MDLTELSLADLHALSLILKAKEKRFEANSNGKMCLLISIKRIEVEDQIDFRLIELGIDLNS